MKRRKSDISIKNVLGNVVISQGQQGGITSDKNVVNNKEAGKKSFFTNKYVLLIGLIASLLGILAYFGLQPKLEESKETETPISVENVSGNVVISQNQSGGITANQVNIGTVPREIKLETETPFLAEIDKHTKRGITIKALFSDAESQALSMKIKNIFEKAGWTIKGYLYEIPNQPIKNVILGVPQSDKDCQTALIIYNWLNMNNLNTTAELVPDEKGYIIYVGLNSN